jgi:hypothetical protein
MAVLLCERTWVMFPPSIYSAFAKYFSGHFRGEQNSAERFTAPDSRLFCRSSCELPVAAYCGMRDLAFVVITGTREKLQK